MFTLAAACCLSGQEVEAPIDMTTDRPGFRNSANLVGAGMIQLENGLRVSTGQEISETSELRVGAFRWLELRLVADEIVLRPPSSSHIAGSADLQPGIKIPLLGGESRKTRIATILQSRVPSGHSTQTTGGFEPGAELIWERDVNDAVSFGRTWNLTRLKQEDFVWQRAASLSMQYSPSQRSTAFAEVYMISPAETGNQLAFNAGITRSIGNSLLVDASAGNSIHGPHDWFVMLGFSVRASVPALIHNTARPVRAH